MKRTMREEGEKGGSKERRDGGVGRRSGGVTVGGRGMQKRDVKECIKWLRINRYLGSL